jgi:hypothetical protein
MEILPDLSMEIHVISSVAGGREPEALTISDVPVLPEQPGREAPIMSAIPERPVFFMN